MLMRLLLLIVLSFTSAMSVAADQSQALRVGVAPNYEPVVFKDGGTVLGIEADLAARVGAVLKREIVFVELPWDELIPALLDARLDIIMSGMSITEARKAQVAFTEPYLQVGQMALIRAADLEQLASPVALYKLQGRVGFEHATTGAAFVGSNLSAAIPVAFDSAAEGISALREGRIEVFIHDAPTVWRVTGDPQERELMGLYWPLTEEYLAWAVRKDDTALRDAINAGLAEWRERGELRQVLDRWMRIRIEVPTR